MRYVLKSNVLAHIKWEADLSRWYIIANSLFFYLTKASAKFKVATSNGLGGDAFTKKNTLVDL